MFHNNFIRTPSLKGIQEQDVTSASLVPAVLHMDSAKQATNVITGWLTGTKSHSWASHSSASWQKPAISSNDWKQQNKDSPLDRTNLWVSFVATFPYSLHPASSHTMWYEYVCKANGWDPFQAHLLYANSPWRANLKSEFANEKLPHEFRHVEHVNVSPLANYKIYKPRSLRNHRSSPENWNISETFLDRNIWNTRASYWVAQGCQPIRVQTSNWLCLLLCVTVSPAYVSRQRCTFQVYPDPRHRYLTADQRRHE